MANRTFKLDTPRMKGDDVRAWQKYLIERFDKWDIDYPLVVTGEYDIPTRAATASFMRGWGVADVGKAMAHGLTPEWRIKLRNNKRDKIEEVAFESRKEYRRALRGRYIKQSVSSPLALVLEDSWGYHPPVHDGIDLICRPNAALLAVCDAKVVRADTGGWWGKGAPTDPALRSKGDGIIILRSLTNVGPFNRSLNFCYGHAEKPVVKVGQVVNAGQHIGTAGFANAWHVHFMVNGRSDTKGVGDRDPRLYLDYAEMLGR